MVSTRKDCASSIDIARLWFLYALAKMVSIEYGGIQSEEVGDLIIRTVQISGGVLAIACSYMYELETHPDPLPEDSIYIRFVTDQETKPK
jgi:hypothetical protein